MKPASSCSLSALSFHISLLLSSFAGFHLCKVFTTTLSTLRMYFLTRVSFVLTFSSLTNLALCTKISTVKSWLKQRAVTTNSSSALLHALYTFSSSDSGRSATSALSVVSFPTCTFRTKTDITSQREFSELACNFFFLLHLESLSRVLWCIWWCKSAAYLSSISRIGFGKKPERTEKGRD